MAYSDFTLRSAVETFGLVEGADADLFPDVPPLDPGEHLRTWLAAFLPTVTGMSNEYARTVLLIGPILGAAKLRSGPGVNLMPGVTFDVDGRWA